jgi:hypothetical protein
MQTRVGQFHLGFRTSNVHDAQARGLTVQVIKQRGLADAGLAAHHQRRAGTAARIDQQPVQHRKLAPPADQGR